MSKRTRRGPVSKFDLSDGCAITAGIGFIGVFIAGAVASYFVAGYTLNYWGSQVRDCPMEFGFIPKIGVTILTPGYIFPIALGTYIIDEVTGSNDVPTAPRARQLGIPVCDS